MRRRNWVILTACLLAPAGAAFLRKITPGQPAALEPGGVGMVLLATVWLLTQRRWVPKWVRGPLLVWAYFQLVYAILAIAVDWRIGVTATVIRIGPMFMAPIAYAALRHSGDLRDSTRWVGILAVVLLPIGLIVAAGGQEAVPYWLRPIQELIDLRKDVRKGVPGFAGIFASYHVLGLSMMAVFYLAMANVAQAEVDRRPTRRWWLFALCALVLVYLSTRRGAFLGVGLGLAVYGIQRGGMRARWVLPGSVVAVLLLGTATYYSMVSPDAQSGVGRGELLIEAFSTVELLFRLSGVFLPHVWMWMRLTPFGTFLGAAGPEGAALGWDVLSRFSTDLIEVGAGKLLLETGWAGAMLMPMVVAVLMWRVYRRSRGLRCHRAVTLLATYQCAFFGIYYMKEMYAMTGVSIAQLLFWAVPGIAAALIERERRERRYIRTLLKHSHRTESGQYA